MLWVAQLTAAIALMEMRVLMSRLLAPLLPMLAPSATMVSMPSVVMRNVPLALLDTKVQVLPFLLACPFLLPVLLVLKARGNPPPVKLAVLPALLVRKVSAALPLVLVTARMIALHVLTVHTVPTLARSIAPLALSVTTVLITSLLATLKAWLVPLALKGPSMLPRVAPRALLVLMVSRVLLSLKLVWVVLPLLCVSAPCLATDVLRVIGLMVLVPQTALVALPVMKAATIKALPTERPSLLLA